MSYILGKTIEGYLNSFDYPVSLEKKIPIKLFLYMIEILLKMKSEKMKMKITYCWLRYNTTLNIKTLLT